MNTEEIGQAMRERRKSLGIDQKALSAISGISVHTLSDIESGRGNPTVSILNSLLDSLGMELLVMVSREF